MSPQTWILTMKGDHKHILICKEHGKIWDYDLSEYNLVDSSKELHVSVCRLKEFSKFLENARAVVAGRPRGRSLSGVGSLLHIIQTGSGARSTSYPMGNGGSSPGVKLTTRL
jgi:hypothetical protein